MASATATQQGSHFSDNALSTFESLVLECQLENAHQALEQQQSKHGGSKRGSKKATPKHHEMPFEDHQYILTLKGNDQCADCGCADTEWASVSFGILLCTKCSGLHRALGTHVSRVRSIKMDSWTDNHIQAMRLGGNKKCRDYLKKQGLDLGSCSIKDRYESPVAQKYHKRLKKQIKAVVAETNPTLEKSGSRSSLGASLGSLNGNSSHSRLSLTAGSSHSLASEKSRPTNPPAAPIIKRPSVSPTRRGMSRNGSGSRASFKSPKSLSASCPTIVYLGRSFKANNPDAYHGDEETLRISDNDYNDVTRKLEQLWYAGDEDNDNHPMSSNQSYASTSLSSASRSSSSSSSYFGGLITFTNCYSNVAELSMKDIHSLQQDLDVKEYVRQQLLKRWKSTNR